MSFSDEDPPRRRRRGRGRARDDDGFDDFWSRENIGPPGRSRRRRDGAPEADPADVADPARSPSPDRAPDPARPPSPDRAPDPARPPSGGGSDSLRPPPAGRSPRPVGAQAALERRRAREQAGARPGAPGEPVAGVHGPPPRAREPGRGGDPGVRPPWPGGGPGTADPSRAGPGPGDAYGSGDVGRGDPYGSGDVGRGDAYGSGDVGRGDPYGGAGTRYGGGDPRGGDPYGGDEVGYGEPYVDDGDYGDEYSDDDFDDEGDDADATPPELPRRRGCRRVLVALGVLVVVAVVAGWFAWSWVQGRIDPAGAPGEVVLVEIPEGTSTAGVGDVLADAGVISDATVWSWYTRLNDPGTIKAGRYEMRLDSSFDEAIDALGRDPLPPDVEQLVTVPPGLTQAQVAARLVDPDKGVPGFTPEAVQAAMDDPAARSSLLPAGKPLEGTLYPETYAVEDGDAPLDVIGRMVAELDGVAGELDLTARAAALGRTPYEVLIVASLVEREAGVAEDGPRIARVIYNRLAAGEPLGVDATSCYEVAAIPCELTEAELEDGTPYDTRSKPGLPPTPIASPGRASISAALHPADGPWRWYVLDAGKDDGSSYFTDDYKDFQAAKARCIEAGLGCG